MTTLNDRFQQGQQMRDSMSGGDRSHFTLPGTDQLAPDLKRIIDEALFGSIWTRPGPDQAMIKFIARLLQQNNVWTK